MQDKPNILLLLGEQHRGDCLSVEGHPVLLTPNMDSIGGRGSRFVNAYTSCPVCVPARRSLLSGQFPATHGALTNCKTEWPVEHTVATALRDGGFQTGWVGRSMHQFPFRKRFGFEEVVLSDNRCPSDDYDEFLNRNMAEGGAGYWGSGVMHNDWTARPFHLPEELHHTNWTIHEAQRFLHRRDPSRPFFLVASFMAAHPPLAPPAYYFERYLRTGVPDPMIGDWAVPPDHGGLGQGVKGSNVDPLTGAGRNVDLTGERLLSARAGYYGLINHLDDQIRRLIHETQGSVDLGNTIILYTADHGEMLGDHHLWSKLVPYQPSIRIPLLVCAPDSFGFQKGSVQDQLVCLEDLMPTLLELADLPIPSTVEGKSLVPILKGENPAWREVLHIECAPIHHTLTDGKEKYIWFAADGKERYFNLENDPNEMQDLVGLPESSDRMAYWRELLISTLTPREEGFSDGQKLISGKPYPRVRKIPKDNTNPA